MNTNLRFAAVSHMLPHPRNSAAPKQFECQYPYPYHQRVLAEARGAEDDVTVAFKPMPDSQGKSWVSENNGPAVRVVVQDVEQTRSQHRFQLAALGDNLLLKALSLFSADRPSPRREIILGDPAICTPEKQENSFRVTFESKDLWTGKPAVQLETSGFGAVKDAQVKREMIQDAVGIALRARDGYDESAFRRALDSGSDDIQDLERRYAQPAMETEPQTRNVAVAVKSRWEGW
jgi:hypothetical protein